MKPLDLPRPMQGGGTPCHGRRVREQDGNRWYIAATWLATSNDYTILLTKLNERLRENGLIWVIYFYHFLIHFDLTFRFFLPPFLKNSRRRPPMSFNPKRCNRTPFFHPLGCRFTQVPGTPFFATLADHFRLSRVEISWTNFLPSSLSCETSKPFKFHKSLVLYCSFFSSGLLDQKTTKQAETTSRLRHQAEFLFKSKQKVNWYDMSSLSLIHWWSCCFLCDTETIPVVSWIFLAAPGGVWESGSDGRNYTPWRAFKKRWSKTELKDWTPWSCWENVLQQAWRENPQGSWNWGTNYHVFLGKKIDANVAAW